MLEYQIRRILSVCVAAAHIFVVTASAVPASVYAQSANTQQDAGIQNTDIDPPNIEFVELKEGRRGDNQAFSATVTDNVSVDSVTFYYRIGRDANFSSQTMKSIAGTSIYRTSVSTTDTTEDVIQYYIEARDGAANRTVKGIAFDPLERNLVDSELISTLPAESDPVQAGVLVVPGLSTNKKILYGALGVLILGALAGAAAGGGSGSTSGGSTGPQVPLTVVVDPLN